MNQKSPTCPDCTEEFDTQQRFPTLLPKCGHSICKECLIKRINNSQLRCPFDYTDFGSSFNNIDDFSPNYHILHLLGAKYNLMIHICELHQQKEDIICLADQKLICSQCALSADHVGHEVHPLSAFHAITEQKKAQLHRISEKIKENVSSFIESLDEKIEIMKESVKEKFDLLRLVLENHESKIMSDIDKIYVEERAKFKQVTSGVSDLECEINPLSTKTKTSEGGSLINLLQKCFLQRTEILSENKGSLILLLNEKEHKRKSKDFYFGDINIDIFCLQGVRNNLIELDCMMISPEIRKLVQQDFGNLEIQADELLISIGGQYEEISNLQIKETLLKEMSIFEPLNEEVTKLTAMNIETMKFKQKQLWQFLGEFAYPLVNKITGPKFAPKVTGMLIDLSVLEVGEVLEMLINEKALKERVSEAMDLLKEEGWQG